MLANVQTLGRLLRTCLAILVPITPLLGQAEQTWDSFDGTLISPAPYSSRVGLSRREIVLSSPKLVIPLLASAENSDYGKLYTVLETANVSDADVQYNFQIRGSDGALLAMPFAVGVCPLCLTVQVSSHESTIAANGGGGLEILPRDPLKIGWAELISDPEGSLALSAMLYVESGDGAVSRVGIPPTAMHRQAWLYADNSSDFATTVVLINPSTSENQTFELNFRNFSDASLSCQATVTVVPLGQSLIETAASLPCSANEVGLIEMNGQHEFTGIAIVFNEADDATFARQFIGKPTQEYVELEQWVVSNGQVQYGSLSSGGCLTIGNTLIDDVSHTVHSSKWQKRTSAEDPWTDVPETDRTGEICAHAPAEPGQYRAVAEISIDGERGMYASSNVVTVEAEETVSSGSGE